ncbi:MAG: ubiquinone biosynthesis regulatory protein kinase UbiB [Gammaproteobacteria bacterium]|nr:ubiquinone biosynthesis regulatory protein kinase UbiB [Pseudomonadota bacterium]MCZ6536908.1 ubiquinone biosynthesis regulatory protein kinase UbiB [Gammaproteobacteria bacterium]MCZ6687339.1 ubiquinone biosynthesis regulatory protein kinase UbiB [Gammaproteobacteria bacterium]
MRNLVRLLQINRVLVNHGLDDIVQAAHLFRPLRLIARLSPASWGAKKQGPRGERIRLALQELGPIFVKFGQALSTRRDLLPLDIADELAMLQDRVPPFPSSVAKAMAEKAYGQSLDDVFDRFDDEPLAAASIAQVHKATLKSGEEVIVKILRPGVEAQIRQDLDVLHALARLAQRHWPEARRLRPVDVVNEYEKTVIDELDMMREAANAAQLKRNFADSDKLYVPEIFWKYCRPDILVMERISGVPISDMDTLNAAGTDMRKLAENGVEIFFTQVFKHNFFHADMHPGNIFVDISDPSQPRYIAVDFGIVGTLSSRDQHYLAENFLAFFERDYYRVAKLHVDSGWVPPETRIDEFESAIRTVCEPIFNKPLKDISFGQVLLGLFRTARRFNMEIQPQLVLLQKTLLNIEGLGRQLYPDLDLWKTAHPILRGWVEERVSGKYILQRLREQLPELGESLQSVPELARNLIEQLADGRFNLQVTVPEIEKLRAEQMAGRKQQWRAIAGASTLVSGVLLVIPAGVPLWLAGTVIAAGMALMFSARP